MPLREGYGVLIGTEIAYDRDDPAHPGHFKHSHLTVNDGSAQYDCAIDTDDAGESDGHLWSIISLNPNDFSTVLQLAEGWYTLEQTPDSGALDYIRSPAIGDHQWVSGDSQEASTALESVIDCSRIGHRRWENILRVRRTLRLSWSLCPPQRSSRQCIWCSQYSSKSRQSCRRRT
jgi:hypothetical protein